MPLNKAISSSESPPKRQRLNHNENTIKALCSDNKNPYTMNGSTAPFIPRAQAEHVPLSTADESALRATFDSSNENTQAYQGQLNGLSLETVLASAEETSHTRGDSGVAFHDKEQEETGDNDATSVVTNEYEGPGGALSPTTRYVILYLAQADGTQSITNGNFKSLQQPKYYYDESGYFWHRHAGILGQSIYGNLFLNDMGRYCVGCELQGGLPDSWFATDFADPAAHGVDASQNLFGAREQSEVLAQDASTANLAVENNSAAVRSSELTVQPHAQLNGLTKEFRPQHSINPLVRNPQTFRNYTSIDELRHSEVNDPVRNQLLPAPAQGVDENNPYAVPTSDKAGVDYSSVESYNANAYGGDGFTPFSPLWSGYACMREPSELEETMLSRAAPKLEDNVSEESEWTWEYASDTEDEDEVSDSEGDRVIFIEQSEREKRAYIERWLANILPDRATSHPTNVYRHRPAVSVPSASDIGWRIPPRPQPPSLYPWPSYQVTPRATQPLEWRYIGCIGDGRPQRMARPSVESGIASRTALESQAAAVSGTTIPSHPENPDNRNRLQPVSRWKGLFDSLQNR